jgi:hypothetical protein
MARRCGRAESHSWGEGARCAAAQAPAACGVARLTVITGPQVLNRRREAGGAIDACAPALRIICCIQSSCTSHGRSWPARSNRRRRDGRRELLTRNALLPVADVASALQSCAAWGQHKAITPVKFQNPTLFASCSAALSIRQRQRVRAFASQVHFYIHAMSS